MLSLPTIDSLLANQRINLSFKSIQPTCKGNKGKTSDYFRIKSAEFLSFGFLSFFQYYQPGPPFATILPKPCSPNQTVDSEIKTFHMKKPALLYKSILSWNIYHAGLGKSFAIKSPQSAELSGDHWQTLQTEVRRTTTTQQQQQQQQQQWCQHTTT